MIVKVSDYIAQFLVDNGITDCFMVTGGGAMHLDDALGHQNGLKCTFNHHEQACAIAAEAYTRMTGNLAAVCVTSGPGGTNAITGVVGGWLDSIPMLVLSGQVKFETTIKSCPELNLRQLGDQEFNIADTVSTMTKFSVMVTNPKKISYYLEKALYVSKSGRPGPVWLDIPLDVQGAKVDTDELIHFDNREYTEFDFDIIDDKLINVVSEKIKNAKAPLILAGTGIHLGKAERELLDFIDKYKIPVVTAWNANDTVAFDNPYFVGMPGTVGIRSGNFAVQNCDLLISLGCRMNIRMIGYNHFDFAKNAFKIIVDIDSEELKKTTVQQDMPICADVKEFLNGMLSNDYTPDGRHNRWVKWCRDLLFRFPVVLPEYHSFEKLLNPYVFVDKLFEQLKCDDRIICGNGSACVITFQTAKIKQGQRMFTNSGCAAMGYGFPAAVGVAVSDNSKRVICIDGDGSIMMNLQELATVSYNKLNIKVFIINNNGYLSIRQTQNNLFEPPLIGVDNESGIEFPDFEMLSKAFNIPYLRLENEADCDRIISEVIESDGPIVCEVVVDYNQNFEPKSSSKVLPDGSIVSPSIDDMKPFLDRKEFETIKFIKDNDEH